MLRLEWLRATFSSLPDEFADSYEPSGWPGHHDRRYVPPSALGRALAAPIGVRAGDDRPPARIRTRRSERSSANTATPLSVSRSSGRSPQHVWDGPHGRTGVGDLRLGCSSTARPYQTMCSLVL